MKTKIESKIFEVEDYEEFNRLSKEEYDQPENKKNLLNTDLFKKNYFSWKFLENDAGKSKYFYLKSDTNKIVGRLVSAIISGFVCYKNEKKKIFFLSDLIIEKKFRSPINNLINLYKKCVNETGGIIFQSSNKKSEKFYEKVLQKKSLFYLKSYGLPLTSKTLNFKNKFINAIINLLINIYLYLVRIVTILLSKMSTIKIDSVDINNLDPKIFEIIKTKLKEKEIIYLDRNIKFVKWRLSMLSEKNILLISNKKELLGYLITTNKIILDMNNFIILDYFFGSKLNFFDKFFLRSYIISLARKKNSDNIFTMGNKKSLMYDVLTGLPLLKIPDAFLPHETPIYFHNNETILFKNKFKNLNVSPMDLDYF